MCETQKKKKIAITNKNKNEQNFTKIAQLFLYSG